MVNLRIKKKDKIKKKFRISVLSLLVLSPTKIVYKGALTGLETKQIIRAGFVNPLSFVSHNKLEKWSCCF